MFVTDQKKPEYERQRQKAQPHCKGCAAHHPRHRSGSVHRVQRRHHGVHPGTAQASWLSQLQKMQLRSMIISSIKKPYNWLWNHYAQSKENQAIRIHSVREIIKTRHNGKSNSVIKTIPSHQTLQNVKALHGNCLLHPETQLIEFTQRLER